MTGLSGGQQQRVACARAMLARPDVIFADEPTGNLDSRAGAEILGLLRDAVHRRGQTVVMVTHDPNAAAHADRVVFLLDGRIVRELHDPTAACILDELAHLDARVPAAGGLGQPWGQVAAYLALGVVIGTIACVAPAIRAARQNVLAAIAYE